ncbi:MAG: thiolase family protein [Deltaproteobacteria bacterium]|nr:thiolase family protein [Deltaproteobacteria bacterium]
MMETVIVSAARTPIGSFQGALSSLTATKLGSLAIAEALQRAGLKPAEVQEVIMGCVLPAGLGQAPARQASLGAGLPKETGCLTINKVCGSGLKSVMLADAMIRNGDAEVVIAGGMESMSNVPYLLPKGRSGYRLGNGQVIDSLVNDGLWDVYNNFHMGSAAELCAREYKISREAQDEFAIESYRRAQKAIADGKFKSEIIAVEVAEGKTTKKIDLDEEPGKANFEKLKSLKPAFEKEGTVTAGNASKINDGAAAVLLMSSDLAKKKGLRPLAKIVGHAGASVAPEWFTVAPSEAIQKVLNRLQMKTSEIDLWEINEAFSVVALVNNKKLGLSADRVNIHGGAVALGHPIGASGARILTTLLYSLQETGAKRGCASLCIGGGEGVALVVERMS